MKPIRRIVSKTTVFLLVFIILTALHGAVLAYLYNSHYSKNLAIILKSQENMIDFEQARISRELKDILQDLLLLEGIAEAGLTGVTDPELLFKDNSVSRRFYTLLGSLTQRYRSMRIFSPRGVELYSLEFDEKGELLSSGKFETVQIIDSLWLEDLKRSEHRENSLYVSRIKLDEDNGTVIEPPTALLRMGRGIQDSSGELAAFILLEYRASHILDQLPGYEILPEETFNSYLINNEGYFLSASDNRPVFGFQYPPLKNESVPRQSPDVWLQFQMNESGLFNFEGSFYVHRRINLGTIFNSPVQGLITQNIPEERYCYLVYETPEPVLKFLSRRVIKSLIIPFFITQSLILLLSILLANWTNRLQRYQQKLLQFSSMDEMTGCMNRRTGRKILENHLSLSRRRNSMMSVVYLDLNNLKSVNDEYGHGEGDHYILTMVNLIKEQLRNTDFFIRMGGDKFLLILPDCSKKEAVHIRKRVLVREFKLNIARIYPYDFGMSWGILELSPERHPSIEEILSESDKLMYMEKMNYPQVDDKLLKEMEEVNPYFKEEKTSL